MSETNPPAWTAKYWASINAESDDRIRIDMSGNTHLIYVNGESSGVLTSDVDQNAVTSFRGTKQLNYDYEAQFFQQIHIEKETNSTIWKKVGDIIFPGTNNVGNISVISILSYMDEGTASYDVRLVVGSGSPDIVATKTGVVNTLPQIVDMGTLSNLPGNESALEIHVKKNGGPASKKIHIESVFVKY